MIDRIGGPERDEEEEEGEGDMLICILDPFRRRREEISPAEREKDLWSRQPWWMDVTCSVWSFIYDIWYSRSSGRSKTHAVMKAISGQKCDVLDQQTRNVSSNIGWIPSGGRRVHAVSVYLSYELYSLLWWCLRAPDQQFPGRHSELSDRRRGSALSQRAPEGRRPFVKRPVTSTAFTVDPAGIYVLI